MLCYGLVAQGNQNDASMLNLLLQYCKTVNLSGCLPAQGTFPAVAAAVETVMPVSDLAYIGYAHCEGDECGAMNMFLEAVS